MKIDIEFGKLYTITMPEGEIGSAGVTEITDLIRTQKPLEGEWKRLNPAYERPYVPTLPADWLWSWEASHDGYRGTFPRRVSKYLHDEWALKCPSDFLAEVGSIARRHMSYAVVYTFDFTNQIDWSAGDFGDSGSCYWGSKAGGKAMIRDNGGMAIRFFAGSHGYARAWIAVMSGYYVVFNGYGFKDRSTVTIARVFAAFMEATYRKVELVNFDDQTGALWINNGHQYAVGDATTIANLARIDLQWDEVWANACYSCGEELDEYSQYIGADEEVYCGECFSDRFDECDLCDQIYDHDALTYLESEDIDVCESCLDYHFRTCIRCDEYIRNKPNTLHCPDCLEEFLNDPMEADHTAE